MSVSINLYGVTDIRAHSPRTMMAPLFIRLGGKNDSVIAEIVIFTDNQQWTDRLAAAINAVSPPVEELIPEPDNA